MSKHDAAVQLQDEASQFVAKLSQLEKDRVVMSCAMAVHALKYYKNFYLAASMTYGVQWLDDESWTGARCSSDPGKMLHRLQEVLRVFAESHYEDLKE